MKCQKRSQRVFTFELLEPRLVLSHLTTGGVDSIGDQDHISEGVEFQPLIVAGDPNDGPTWSGDSPADRVDPNTTTSDYAGVGSLFMRLGKGPTGYICTGTPISSQHVLTAGHCLDTNNDGSIDFRPDRVTFYLNFGGNLTHSIQASALFIHPDYTGFNNPSVNDDLAVITLAAPVPTGVPIYDLYRSPVIAGDTVLNLVGYGRSGDGVNGYYVDASFSVKRVGANVTDALFDDDEGSHSNNEVYLADFDGPDTDGSRNGPLGGGSLGNTVETTLGGGDSGGPGLVQVVVDGLSQLQLATVNTFSVSGGSFTQAPLFGSGLGGILVYAYLDWIDAVVSGGGGGGGDDGGGGKGGGPPPGKGNNKTEFLFGDEALVFSYVAIGAGQFDGEEPGTPRPPSEPDAGLSGMAREHLVDAAIVDLTQTASVPRPVALVARFSSLLSDDEDGLFDTSDETLGIVDEVLAAL